MNKNIENYKKALNELKVDDNLKEKALNNIFQSSKLKNDINSKIDIKAKKRKQNIFTNLKIATYSLTTVLAGAIIVFVGVSANNMNKSSLNEWALQDTSTNNTNQQIIKIKQNDILPKVGSIDNLNKILGNMNVQDKYYYNTRLDGVASEEFITADSAMSITEKSFADISNTSNYSKTNTQVKGVDEADIVKTDGNYIYYVANQKVYIVDAKDPKNIKIETTLEYEENMIPQEIYINNNKLVVILDKSETNNMQKRNLIACYDIAYYDSETIVITYDMRSKTNLLEKRKIQIEGNYINSRMINNEVYVVTNKSIYKTEEGNEIPQYMDTVKDNEKHDVSLEKMLYVPETKNTSYLMIAGFSLENDKEANIKTILGSGHEIYCTEDNLYITRVIYGEPEEKEENGIVSVMLATQTVHTEIYKFKLQDTDIISTAVGKVEGRTLNQFSMGEYNKNFSIVTTADSWQEKSNTRHTKNTLYVLNEKLEQIGILENIADDENLYAARFMGDKAYVVTFEQIDPLFVIDLSNPTQPKILGELKIPGYSSYLQPYDETHLIGIGQDTETETTRTGSTRTVTKGVKVSLFDVSDYTNPKEMYSLVLNDNSHTNASYNHKALLFSKEKNLLAFQLATYEKDQYKQEYVILSIDLENGISIKNKINHGYEKTEYGSEYPITIDRGLYINNNLFTLSDKKVKVVDLQTYNEISELNLL